MHLTDRGWYLIFIIMVLVILGPAAYVDMH